MQISRTIKTSLTIAALAGLMWAGCRHAVGGQAVTPPAAAGGTGGSGGGTPGDTGLCFERDVLPIFQSNCAKSGCHDAASGQDGIVLDSYTNIMKEVKPGNPGGSDVYEVLVEDDEDKRMPQAPNPRLSAGQIAIIRRWISEGALNRTGCAPLCDSNNFRFAANIKPILDNKCRGCHNAASAPNGIALDTHAGAQAAVVSGRLLGAINHSTGFSPMPKSGAKLSDCQIRQMEKWAAAGAQND